MDLADAEETLAASSFWTPQAAFQFFSSDTRQVKKANTVSSTQTRTAWLSLWLNAVKDLILFLEKTFQSKTWDSQDFVFDTF